MFTKLKNKIMVALLAVVAVAVAAVAALFFSPQTEKAYAAADPTLYWIFNADDNELIISADSADTDGQEGHSGSFTSFVSEYNVPWRKYSDAYNGYIYKATVKAGVKPLSTKYWFNDCRELRQVDLSGLDTSETTKMCYMFGDCTNLKTLDISNFKTSKVTAMDYMFYNCLDLKTIVFPGTFVTDNVMNMAGMFNGCASLTSLNLSSFNTENVLHMNDMFDHLTSLDISFFDTAKVTDMLGMFCYCPKLTEINFPDTFVTSEVTDMTNMFWMCSALTSLDLSGFNTEKVTKMNSMFYGCEALTSLNLSGFNTGNVTNMNNMFYGCTALTSLNLSGFNTQNVSEMDSMFLNCSALTSLDLSGFDTANVTNMDNMFWGCSALTSLDLSSFNTSSVTEADGMFYGCNRLTTIKTPATVGSVALPLPAKFEDSEGNVYSSITSSLQGGKTLTRHAHKFVGGVCACGEKKQIYWWITDNKLTVSTRECELEGVNDTDKGGFDFDAVFGSSSEKAVPWLSRREDIVQIKIENGVTPVSLSNWFSWFENLVYIDLSGLDTSNITSMAEMFWGCSALTSLDLSGFDTSNVTDMSMMFCGCSALTEIKSLTSFDTSNVTDMAQMFEGCAELTELDLSSFDMSNVTQQSSFGMIYKCNKLQTIKAPKAIGRYVEISMPLHEGGMTIFKFWNGTADVDMLTPADAGKTLKRHDGHTYAWVTVTEATCTQAGSKQETCSVCGAKNGEAVAVDALGHEWKAEFTVDKAATCTQEGSKSRHCSRCEEKTEVTAIPAAGHDLTHHEAVGATADKAGNIEYWSCADCEKYFSDSEGTEEIADKASVVISAQSASESEPFNPLWLILIIFASLVIVGEVGFIVYRQVRKNKSSEGKE